MVAKRTCVLVNTAKTTLCVSQIHFFLSNFWEWIINQNSVLEMKKLHFANQKEILAEVIKIISEEYTKADSLVDSDSVSWSKEALESKDSSIFI